VCSAKILTETEANKNFFNGCFVNNVYHSPFNTDIWVKVLFRIFNGFPVRSERPDFLSGWNFHLKQQQLCA